MDIPGKAAALKHSLGIAGAVLSLACGNPQGVEVARAWPVMGTMLTVTAWARDSAAALEAIHRARLSVMRVDSLMSSYRAGSDISRAARSAPQPVTVDSATMHVLGKARAYWSLSSGKFDPTIGPLSELWKAARDAGTLPDTRAIDSARKLVNFSRIKMNFSANSLAIPVKGMTIDLGGIAKGYALDQARLAMSSADAGMIDLGGNVLVFGRAPSVDGRWRIGVVDPSNPGASMGVVSIDSGAVATSGDYENFMVLDGKRYSHILDPATGWPARGTVSATVVAPRGELTDGMSASFFLLGARRAIHAADSIPGVAAIMVDDSGGNATARRHVHLSRRAETIFRFSEDFQ